MQQVEGGGRVSLQIVADDIRPDQVIGAQHVEGHRHLAAFENASFFHLAFQRRDLVFVDEHEQIAGMGEIDLRRKERRRRYALAPLLGEPGQRRGEQGAANAVAGGMDLHLARHLFDDVHRGQRALLHVVVEGLLAEFLVRIDPGDHEHRDALIDAPFDVGFFRLEIEDVELVDPGRHDQERRAQHRLRGRRVLDELHQLVLEDHLAGRRRHVDADDEVRRVGLADAQRAVAGLDVFGKHLHAAHEVVAVRGQCLTQHFGIGENEIRRRDRVGDLLDVELGLLARVRIDAFGVLHQFLRPLRGEQIELQHEIEELVRFPLRILETLVARRRLDRRLGRFAGHAARGLAPEVEIGLAHPGLQVFGALRVRQPVFSHLGECLDDLTDFAGRLVFRFPVLARLEIGRERLATRLHRFRDVHGEGFGVEGLRSLGFGVDVTHIKDTIASFRVRHRVD